MGFLQQHISWEKRSQLTERDRMHMDTCMSCRYRSHCGGFSLADDARYCDFRCWDCRAHCCYRIDEKHQIIDDLGGLAIDGIHYRSHVPQQMPNVGFALFGSAFGVKAPLYLIPLSRLFNPRHDTWVAPTPSLRERFQIPKSSRIALYSCESDWFLDTVQFKIQEVAEKVALYGFDFVFPIDFTAFRNFPRLDQMLNLKRRFLSLDTFQKAGVPVIPDITAWDVPREGERILDWMRRERPKHVLWTTHLSGHRREGFREHVVKPYMSWLEKVGYTPHTFVAGLGYAKAGVLLEELGRKATAITARMSFCARCRIPVTREWLSTKQKKALDTNCKMFRFNVDLFMSMASNAVEKSKTHAVA